MIVRLTVYKPGSLSAINGFAAKKGLFGIIQGGLYKDLRIESLEKLKESINILGYKFSGLKKKSRWVFYNILRGCISSSYKRRCSQIYS